MGAPKFLDKVIEYSFYVLFFLVPLFWLPFNSELFEFNKMLLVYLATVVILVAWLLKSINEGSFAIKRTPLDIPIVLFLLANLLPTIFSIDRQTSIFGYYSRWNGGLLSTISYIVLYYALVTFFNKEKLFKLLKILLASSLFVSIYGIAQHHVSIKHTNISWKGIDEGYWAVDSQVRSFSTLGHPNWLAAFLLMVTPFAFFFLKISKKIYEQFYYTILLILIFIAFTFTYSRGGTVGFVLMILILVTGTFFVFREKFLSISKKPFLPFFPLLSILLLLVFAAWVATFYFFGNAFTSRVQPVSLSSVIKPKTETELSGPAGSETGNIRLIVWRGAIETFKHYPIVGSGLETFALDYYKFKPIEQNLTSEWDFVYNKAHNEFLNYLATTGAVGFGSYLILIFAFVFLVVSYLIHNRSTEIGFFSIAILGSYAGYHAQNVFGFSVVAVALLFFTLPAFFFIATENLTENKISLHLKNSFYFLITKGAVILIGLFLIIAVFATWIADYFYNSGQTTTNDNESYQSYKIASNLRPDEPLYKADLGLATINLATKEGNAEKRKEKITEGFKYLNEATDIAPSNIAIWQIELQAVYNLSAKEPAYTSQTVKTAEKISSLAPNAADIQYSLAEIYIFADQPREAQKQLEKVVALKFNYEDAWDTTLKTDIQLNDDASFKKDFEKFKSIFPDKTDQFLKNLNQT
jgi:O-antigen ligase